MANLRRSLGLVIVGACGGAALLLACAAGDDDPKVDPGADAGGGTSSSSSSGGSSSGGSSSGGSSSGGSSSGGTGDGGAEAGPVDECTAGTADCVASATCTDRLQGFACSCPAGYAGSGRPASAGGIDLGDAGCVPPAAGDAGGDAGDAGGDSDAGDAGAGAPSCAVAAGCADVDECAASLDDCVKAPHPARTCTNTPGSFSCSCVADYTGNGRVGDGGTGCDLRADTLHYRFDGAGTTVPNLATNPPAGAETANLMGGNTQGGAGQCGGAMVGTGAASTADYLNTNWPTDLGTGSWTLSFWSKNITPSATLFYPFGDLTAGSLRVFTNGVAGPNNWILRGPVTDTLLSNAALVEATMSTFVYDAVAAQTRGYLNGQLAVTVAQGAVNVPTGAGFKVGGYDTRVGLPAGGLLDEVRLYKRALTNEQIAELYGFTSGCFHAAP